MKKIIALILAALLALSMLTAATAATYTDKDTVKKVQQALNDAGYNCGTPDGVAGKKTAAAITQYQTDKGLEATGTIDDALLQAMGLAEDDKIPDVTMETFVGTWKLDIVGQFDSEGNLIGSTSEVDSQYLNTIVIAPDKIQWIFGSDTTLLFSAPELNTDQKNGEYYLSATAEDGSVLNINLSNIMGDNHIYIMYQDLSLYFKRVGDVEDATVDDVENVAVDTEGAGNSDMSETEAEQDDTNKVGGLHRYMGVWKFCGLFDSKDVVHYYPEELGIDPDSLTIEIGENSFSCIALGIKGTATLEGKTISVETESGAPLNLTIDAWEDVRECIFLPINSDGQNYMFKRA